MLREFGIFTEEFHIHILPSSMEQERRIHQDEMAKILSRLDRIPKKHRYDAGGVSERPEDCLIQEDLLMEQIQTGLEQGDFFLKIEPRCELGTREIVGGEAKLIWNRKDFGEVKVSSIRAIIEKNGFIVKLNRVLWEEVGKTIHSWIKRGIRPIPLAVKISGMDLLGTDVAVILTDLIARYQIPARLVDVEIPLVLYCRYTSMVQELESELRKNGFRVFASDFNGDYLMLDAINQIHSDGVVMDLKNMDEEMIENPQELPELVGKLKKMRLSIYATGVESLDEETILRKAGCLEGQGKCLYPISRVDDLEIMMEHEV